MDQEMASTARMIVDAETPFLGAAAIALFDQASADLRESGGDAEALLRGALNGISGATTATEEAICGAVAYVAAMRVVSDTVA
jgi:hypothetical protein